MNEKIKIYYDYQVLWGQKYGGISRYFFDLISSMKRQDIALPVIKCYKFKSVYFEDYFNKSAYSGNSKFVRIMQGVINYLTTAIELRKDYKIVHPTYYKPYILKLKKKNQKLIITVYDMTHEIYPELFAPTTAKMKGEMIRAADHIIAISENTKKDIMKFHPEINSDKISVIYLATNFTQASNNSVQLQLPRKYVLFVGRRGEYKNFSNFTKSVIPLLKDDRDLSIVCAGGGMFSNVEINSFGDYRDRFIYINGDNDSLCAAYTNAECFVFPSLYEGFGIPTLEAFSCNCPVVLSSTSSMPEVGGDAVEYCDPANIDDINRAIKKVVYDEKIKKTLREKGKKQLEKFDWDDIARKTVRCYENIL